MPNIQKIVVSGSDISQLTNDAGYALATNITGAFTAVSGGLAGRINLLETQGSTNAQTASFVLSDNVKFTVVVSGTSSFETLTAVSTSIAADIASLETTVGAGGLLSSSAQIATDISGAFTAVSGGLAGRINLLETQGATNAQTASFVLSDNVKFTVVVSGTSSLQTLTSVSTSLSTRATSLESRTTTLEGTGTIQGVGTTNNVTFASLTVNGDLFVSGSTTSINSANLNIEDKFILLNSGSAGSPSYEGGIIVESGSVAGAGNAFYFDASDNRWALKNGLSAGNTAGVTAEAFMGIAIVDTLSNAQSSVHFKEGAIIVDNQEIYIVTE
jgi:hypothetical protein